MAKREQLKLFLQFFRFLFAYRRRITWLVIASNAIMLLSLVNPFITKLVIDKAFFKKDLSLFIVLTAIGAGVFVVNGILNGLVGYSRSYLNFKLAFDLRRRITKHLNKLSLGYFKDQPVGQHLYRINYDVDFVTGFLSGMLPEVIEVFLRMLFTVIIIFYLNKELALLSILLSPFLYLPSFYFNRRLRDIFKELNKKREIIFGKLFEVFSNIQLVKAFGKESQELRRYLRRVIASMRIEITSTKLGIASDFFGSAVNRLIVGLIAFYGGFLIIKGRMTLGSLSAIMIYLNQLISLQGSIVEFFRRINFGMVSCQRLNDILETKTVKEPIGARAVVFTEGGIQFKDCTFGYAEDILVLDRMNFTIEGGKAIALVGPSGCGKTTIVNLILRLYEPQSGNIFIDGNNIEGLEPHSFYEQIGVVLQEPFLWNDTIENNVKYGLPEASPAEFIKAAEITGVDILAQSQSQGYQAMVGEDAGKLSQGQKQRIAISRAIIKQPKILILDEAMSSLDIESEKKILQRLLKERKGLTTIIITHRPSAIELAEEVYFLEGKDRITSGTFQQLGETYPKFLSLFNEKPL